jgi:RHS repeat-associated protein
LEYDGLGRLTSVCEVTADSTYGGTCGQVTGGYSGYLTQYIYDLSPNVNSLTVNQNAQPNGGTAQQRVYIYDMLGRLTYESNPETKVTKYYYDNLTGDANCGTVSSPGDVLKTVDQKGVVACFSYDGFHRLISTSYSTGPSKVLVYDGATLSGVTLNNTVGRLAEAYTCAGSCTSKTTDIFFSYSARGEITDTYESTPHSGGYNHVSASYWPHRVLSTLSVPSLSTLPTIYYGVSDGSGLDGEGRITKVTAGTSTNLASLVTYTTSGTTEPIGTLTGVTYGSGDSDQFSYDTLTGRLTNYAFNMNSLVAKSGALTWNANGSLKQAALTDNLNSGNTQTCSYSHDDLARIASVNCVKNSTTTWGQSFAFDPFGNITKNATAGTTFAPSYNMSTNRYTSLPGCTPTYDGDGHLTNDCIHTYLWQGDGAVSKVDSVAFTYDALGRIVEQKNGTSYTEVLYSPGGGKLALLSGSTVLEAFIPLPGGGTAVYNSNGLAYYRHSDWLGSSRLASTTSAPTSVYSDSEYAPYGEPYGLVGSLDLNFTGQNQDAVPSQSSGLYDFLFREFNPQHGRWISPDPDGMSAVSMGNPQTWNRYAYVANGPLTSTDQLGLVNTDRFDVGGFDDSCSIDGMAASCGLVDSLADMGGGGEAGILLNGYLNPVNIGIGWAIPSFSSEGLSWGFMGFKPSDYTYKGVPLNAAALAEILGLNNSMALTASSRG